MAAAATGDSGAWESLVAEHSALVWSIIRALGVTEPDASDVFQIVFLRLTEHLSSIEPPALRAWLRTVTRRCCYDVSRRRQRLPLPTDSLPDAAAPWRPTTEEIVELAEEERAVVLGFARLSEACQRLLRLTADREDYSYAEIAEMLDMPIGSIGPTRGRCLERLAATTEVRALGIGRVN